MQYREGVRPLSSGSWQPFRAVWRLRFVGAALALGFCGSASAQGPAPQPGSLGPQGEPIATVEAVNIELNRYIQKETFLYYVSTKPGDRYDEVRLKDDFQRLWETGLLDDLLLDVKDGRTGKIVTFRVQERKRIAIIDYRGSKALTKSSIEDKLKEKEAGIKVDSFYDMGKARRVEGIVRQMLSEAGRAFGTVRHEVKPVGAAGVQLSFIIDDGPKAKVKEIVFLGNRVFSDGTLRRHMGKIKARGFWNLSWLSGKTKYTEEKWREDQTQLREFYLNHGYVTAAVGEPAVTYFDGPARGGNKRPAKWVRLEIPVAEGDQYRVGTVKFEGLTVFREPAVRSLFKIQPGQVYKESRIKKGYEKLGELYGAWGYFQWTPLTKRNTDDQKKLVNVVLEIQEEKRYFVGKIAFKGNDVTRDKVIRREVYLNEGDVFNTEALKSSIKRINQLGYFKPMEKMPDLAPSQKGEDRIDVTFSVEEQNRNQFMLGGGKGAYEGYFVNSSFSTSNFLGGGETVSMTVQSGSRIKQYQLALSEPYFLDRPMTAGIDVYKRRLEALDYQDIEAYADDRIGTSLTAGLPLGRFTRLYGNYTYEIVNIERIDPSKLNPTQYYYPTSGTSAPALSYRLDDYGKRYESRLSPSLIYNTVDNPITPRSGMKLSASLGLAGGPIGGTMNYVKPDLEAVVYLPHTRRTALGLRAEAAWVRPFGRTAVLDPTNGGWDKLPFYNRFALGGEQQVRGYDIYALRPVDASGVPLTKPYIGLDANGEPKAPENRVVFGDKFLLFNAEYYFDIVGSLRALLFYDMGQAYTNEQPFKLKQMKISTGAEVRFMMPVLNVPVRLIYAINPNRGAHNVKYSAFKFAVGTTF